MPKKINIFLSVIDNLWDIGFAAELIRSFDELYPSHYFFDIWTDNLEKTEQFFRANDNLRWTYQIQYISDIANKEASISFLLFHHPIPDDYPKNRNELFLRIDYLSFDREWVIQHGNEHVDSRENQKIIEIIPSPQKEGGGLISPPKKLLSRSDIAWKYTLEQEKKWITIFSYKDTFENYIEFDEINDIEILLLGTNSEYKKSFASNKNIHELPFLSLIEFSSIIRESYSSIIRWEVSFISTLQLETPFFWDMYKEIGGFYREQAHDFLKWYGADNAYEDIFYRLNGVKKWGIKISEMQNYFKEHEKKRFPWAKNLTRELQKYIDKYHFSL